jgi:O-antigen/teichoic acid export membrane protein
VDGAAVTAAPPTPPATATPAGRFWAVVHRLRGNPVALSLGSRVLAMATSMACGVLSTRMLIEAQGPSVYAQINLIVTLVALLPFVDLGVGVAVTNAVSTDGPRRAVPVLRTSLRCIAGTSAAVLVVSLGCAAVPGWRSLLGIDGLDDGQSNAAVLVVAALFVLNAPLGVGQRAMLGLQRNHVVGAFAGVQAALALVATWVLVSTDAPVWALVAPTPLAMLLCSAALFGWSCRLIGIRARFLVAETLFPRRFPGARIRTTAVAALLITCGTALAMQTHRLLLSHLSDVGQLAQYALAAQFYAPVWGVVSTAGLALWPMFRQRAAQDPGADRGRLLDRYVLAFLGLGIVFATGYLVLSPVFADLLSDGTVTLETPLRWAFAALILVQCAQVPSGMALFGPRGLRIQAGLVLGMAALNLGLSWAMTPALGATAPVLGTVLSTLAVQLVPTYVLARTGRVDD